MKFVRPCEAPGISMLRIGGPDNSVDLEIQELATWQLNDIRASHQGTLAELCGQLVRLARNTKCLNSTLGI